MYSAGGLYFLKLFWKVKLRSYSVITLLLQLLDHRGELGVLLVGLAQLRLHFALLGDNSALGVELGLHFRLRKAALGRLFFVLEGVLHVGELGAQLCRGRFQRTAFLGRLLCAVQLFGRLGQLEGQHGVDTLLIGGSALRGLHLRDGCLFAALGDRAHGFGGFLFRLKLLDLLAQLVNGPVLPGEVSSELLADARLSAGIDLKAVP